MRWSLMMIDVYNHFEHAGVLEGEVHGGVEVPHVEAPGRKSISVSSASQCFTEPGHVVVDSNAGNLRQQREAASLVNAIHAKNV